MNTRLWAAWPVVLGGWVLLLSAPSLPGQEKKEKKEPEKKDFFKGPFGFGGPMMGGTRKLVEKFDKDGDGRLNTEERKAARESLKKERAGGGPGGFRMGGGPGGPKGFGPPGGPGGFLSKPLLDALDTNKDAKLSREELVAGVKKFFADNDKEKVGSLTEPELAEALNKVIPQPPGMRRPPGGPGGPGGPPMGFGLGNPIAGAIARRADKNKDEKLTRDELVAAAEALFTEVDKDKKGVLDEKAVGEGLALVMPRPQFMGGPGGRGREPAKPGPKVTPAEVANHPKAGLYDPTVLRTIFMDFEDKDWEAELADFKGTDVEVPATLTVDGKKYANVGVHFRGMSSFGMIPAGSKRSFGLSMDLADKGQRLYGYKTLNLLNSNDDPSFLHTVLYSHVARQYIPTPKANLVKVVINGESWGVYVNVQQFNKEFTKEFFKSDKGARWKVRGSPGGGGGLEYVGDKVEDYKRRFEIKSKDDPKAWKALINLCKVLNTTPADKLEEALKPILDVEGALWFLALDVALVNNDGYWVRASDYSIYLDQKGKFHLVPHDMNETFSPAMMMGFGPGGPGGRGPGKGGPGGPGGPGGRGPGKGGPGGPGPGGMGGPGGRGGELDPLVALDDTRKPLRSKLLAVPALRQRYLKHVREIAEKQLDWEKLGPVVAGYRKLIEKEVAADTRKLYPVAAFESATADRAADKGEGRGREPSLRAFAEKRREYLLKYEEPSARRRRTNNTSPAGGRMTWPPATPSPKKTPRPHQTLGVEPVRAGCTPAWCSPSARRPARRFVSAHSTRIAFHPKGRPVSSRILTPTRRLFLGGLTFGLSSMFWTVKGAFAEQLALTPRHTEGPFYPDKLPLDTDNDLIVINEGLTPAVGEITHLSGRVLSAAGEPVRNAVVEVWQCDAKAVYLNTKDSGPKSAQRDKNFQGFGRFTTGSTGEYYFRTIKPVPYPGRPAPHIHFKVKKGGKELLTSQFFIAGYPANKRDHVFLEVRDPFERELLSVDFKPVPGSKVGEFAAKFDIVVGLTPDESPRRRRG
ncbi:MAG: CotH kinase family protein [Gemmataceae bacterium]